MLPRKTNHADLERERSVFVEIGLVISLGLVVFMMNLNFKPKKEIVSDKPIDFEVEQEMIPITRQEQTLPPPPAPPKQIKVFDVINIVENSSDIDEDLEIMNTETDQDEKVEVANVNTYEMEEEDEAEASIFVVVEQMPIFRPDICKNYEESQKELMRYVAQAIKYPTVAAENGIEGLVFVSFVVSPSGSVTNVEVIRGVYPALDKEAIRVVENLPHFSPGKQRDKPVRVKYSIPIRFVLR